MEKVYIKDKQGNKVLPITHVSAVLDDEGNDLDSHLGAFEDEVRGLVDTPHQEYITVDTYASLPKSGSKDTIYRVSNYNGSTSQVDASVYSEYAWNGRQYIFLCVKSQIGEVFDISAYNNNTKYADLAAALGTDGVNIPQNLRKGGMSVKFVHSSDNKYVQARLMADSFTTDITQWQGVDVNPTFRSKNLPTSGGVYAAIKNIDTRTESIVQEETQSETDEIIIADNSNNEVVHVSSNGVDAKNLKSNGKRCLTTDDINTHIEQSETQDETSEVIYADDNNNIVLKINDNGVFDKNDNEILGNALAGKKAIFFGDSITEGIATNDWEKEWFGGWPRLFRDNAGMIISNKGVGGTTLRDNAQNNNGICQRLIADATLNQYDYIILSGGFNDFANWSADDSVITNGYNSAFDTTKSMGALENCINYLQKNFPDKHIGFILCYDIGAKAYDAYYEAIVEVLEKWSMPYIDLRKESAFNINNYDQRNVYGVYKGNIAWFDSTQNYETGDKCQYNGVVYSAKHNITAGGSFNEDDWNLSPEGISDDWHINVIGYRKSYSQIKSWIEKL